MDNDAYLLQRIDCNCNNCGFMIRDMEKYQYSLTLHHVWQRQYSDLLNRKKAEKANDWMDKGDYRKASILLQEVDKSKFQFNKSEALIQYGHCIKFSKEVSFIPDTCQLETQQCFIHRKDYMAEK